MNLIPSLFLLTKHKHKHKHKQLWLWPSCNNHPKTLSFRATTDHGPVTLTDPNKDSIVEPEVELTTLGSYFTNSSEYSPSISTESDSSAVETIVRGARSERLFFEPESTSSILENQSSGTQCTSENTGVDDDGGDDDDGDGDLPCKESVAVVMETEDPYDEFKKSMEEMVEIYGLKDWDCMEELLRWYLRMNVKDNHEFIVGAFFDLLAGGCRHGGGGGCGGSGDGECDAHSAASLISGGSSCSSPISSPSGI